ncbi:claudin-34 [Rhinophrynus dorsalis]
MPYLAHTANFQLAGFAFATVGWALALIATGHVQWRVWYVSNTTIITSGVAWIGIWRTCFFSDVKVSPDLETMYCQELKVMDSFVPREIFVAQGLMLVAAILAAAGKVLCTFGLKNIYQSSSNITLIYQYFTAGGLLDLLSSVCIIIPVAWNLHSVVNNYSISFPSPYDMPSSPERQEVGAAIAIGIVAAILLFFSGMFFLCYKLRSILESKLHPASSEDAQDSIFGDDFSITSNSITNSRSFASRRTSTNHTLNSNGICNEAFVQDEKL